MKKIITILILLINIDSNAANIQIYTVAKINNSIITNVDLENEIKILEIIYGEINLKKINTKKIALENLINENLKRIEVEKNKVVIEEELVKKQYNKLIVEIKNKNQEIKEKDMNLIYSKIKIENLWNQYISNKYSWRVNINMQEIEKILANNKTNQDKETVINIEKNKKLNVYSVNHLESLKKNYLIKIYK